MPVESGQCELRFVLIQKQSTRGTGVLGSKGNSAPPFLVTSLLQKKFWNHILPFILTVSFSFCLSFFPLMIFVCGLGRWIIDTITPFFF